MSCTEVMYQPYSPYFPYQRSAAAAAAAAVGSCAGPPPGIAAAAQAACLDYKRFVSPKMQDLLSGSVSSPVSSPAPLQAPASIHRASQPQAPTGGRSSSCAIAVASASSSPVTPLNRTGDEEPNSAAKPSSSAAASRSSPATSSSAATATTAAAADAQYLSANCVVFTYYSGDISSVVDEHFSRALSQPSSYEAACKTGAVSLKDTPPMSQRNFPASFWNCNQQPSASNSPIMGGGNSLTGGASPGDLYSADPYHPHHPHHPHHHHHHHHHHHAAAASANAAALHASLQNDPWHYALTAPQTAPYRSSAMHELAYSAAAAAGGSHRFGTQQYGSLLLQPSVRSSRLTPVSATCTALDKTADAWAAAAAATPGRYHHDQLAGNIAGHVDGNYGGPHYGSMGAAAAAMTGLDTQVQDAGKDLYWF
ncbi:transcription cofactor vestigial-like protein 3 isoform X2 [Ixodes scapularis]